MRILIYSILVFLIGCKEKEQPTFEAEGELKMPMPKLFI